MWIVFNYCFRDDDYPINKTYNIIPFTTKEECVNWILEETYFIEKDYSPDIIEKIKQYLRDGEPVWEWEWKRRGSGDYYVIYEFDGVTKVTIPKKEVPTYSELKYKFLES